MCESLRALSIRAYVGGERVDSIVDSPLIAPHINTVAKTYELAHVPEHARRDDGRVAPDRASGSTATRTSSSRPTIS